MGRLPSVDQSRGSTAPAPLPSGLAVLSAGSTLSNSYGADRTREVRGRVLRGACSMHRDEVPHSRSSCPGETVDIRIPLRPWRLVWRLDPQAGKTR